MTKRLSCIIWHVKEDQGPKMSTINEPDLDKNDKEENRSSEDSDEKNSSPVPHISARRSPKKSVAIASTRVNKIIFNVKEFTVDSLTEM